MRTTIRSIKGGRLLLVAIAALSGACVTSGKYDAKVGELNQSLKREQDLRSDVARLNAELAETHGDLDVTRKQVAQAKAMLERLGQDVSKLSTERGQLKEGLANAEQRLEELRKQKAAAEARAATFRTLVEKL